MDMPPDARRLRYDALITEADRLLQDSDYDGAVKHYAAAAELARDGGASPELGTALHRAAVARDRQGDPKEATWFARQALSVDEAFFGPVHAAVARDLHSLGVILARQSALNDAVDALERSATISRRLTSPGELVTTLLALGPAHHQAGQPDRAAEAMAEAAQVAHTHEGPRSLRTARALLGLAAARGALRQLPAAHATWVEVTRRLSGSGQPPARVAVALAQAWMGLGDLALRARRDLADAAAMFSFAVALVPEGHPIAQAARDGLSAAQRAPISVPPGGLYRVVARPAGQPVADVAHPTGGRWTVDDALLESVLGRRAELGDRLSLRIGATGLEPA